MPDNPQQPHQSHFHHRHSFDEATLYTYTPLEMWAVSQAEWTSLIRDEALGSSDLDSEISQPRSQFALVTFGFVMSLLCISTVTLIWNADRLTEAVVKVVENTEQEVTGPNHRPL